MTERVFEAKRMRAPVLRIPGRNGTYRKGYLKRMVEGIGIFPSESYGGGEIPYLIVQGTDTELAQFADQLKEFVTA